MKQKEVLEWIEKADKKSPEFFDVVVAMGEKYFNFEKPDSYQEAGQLLWLIIMKADEWHAELTAKLANELFQMVEMKRPAIAGSFGVKDKEYWYEFTDDPKGFGKMEKLLRNTLIVKSREET